MKMKLITMFMVTALILAFSGWAEAGSFNPYGYSGPVVMHVSTWDMGTVWYIDSGLTTLPDPGIYGDPRIANDTGMGDPLLYADQAKGAMTATEDTWGIIRVDQILPGYVETDHAKIEPTGGLPLYNHGDSGVELWGIFYDHTDTYTEVTAPDYGQNTMGTGLKVQIFAQPFGTFTSIHGPAANKAWGSGDRLSLDQYAGIGYDAIGNPIAGATPWLTGEAQEGFFADPMTGWSTVGDYTLASQFWPGGQQDGEAQLWISMWEEGNPEGYPVGTANDKANQDWFWASVTLPGMGTETADARIQMNTEIVPYNPSFPDYDWLVTNKDPIEIYFPIPEPVTMLGMFLGIGGLSGYIRRRNMV